ncbi:HAD family hydrolase [Myxosarcina sp. GI1(2024)]
MVTILCKGIIFNDIEAIIFDKDGTLENSQIFSTQLALARVREIEAQISGVTALLLEVFGIKENTLDSSGLMAVGSRQENQIAAAACIAATGCSWFFAKQIANDAFAAADQLVFKDSNSASLFSGCLPKLEFFAQAGLKLGILSADSTAEVRAFVRRFSLAEYIQLAMGVDGELNKPDPKLFIRACQALSVKPSNTLMVGDSSGDIAMATAARAAGTIGISWNSSIINDLNSADATISSLSEIQILNSAN